jgi:hypothetical protein
MGDETKMRSHADLQALLERHEVITPAMNKYEVAEYAHRRWCRNCNQGAATYYPESHRRGSCGATKIEVEEAPEASSTGAFSPTSYLGQSFMTAPERPVRAPLLSYVPRLVQ